MRSMFSQSTLDRFLINFRSIFDPFLTAASLILFRWKIKVKGLCKLLAIRSYDSNDKKWDLLLNTGSVNIYYNVKKKVHKFFVVFAVVFLFAKSEAIGIGVMLVIFWVFGEILKIFWKISKFFGGALDRSFETEDTNVVDWYLLGIVATLSSHHRNFFKKSRNFQNFRKFSPISRSIVTGRHFLDGRDRPMRSTDVM